MKDLRGCPYCHHERAELFRSAQETKSGTKRDIYSCSECHAVYPRPRMGPGDAQAYLNQLYADVEKVRYSNLLPTVAELEKIVRPGMTVLDIGAFCGDFCLEIEKIGAAAVGIEPLQRACELAVDNSVEVYNGFFPDMIPEEIQQRQFDLIVASEVIYYFVDLKKSLEKIYELLRPGGYFFIKACQAQSKYYDNPGNSYFLIYGDYVQAIPTKESLEISLTRQGFEILLLKGLSTPFTFTKKLERNSFFRSVASRLEYYLNRYFSSVRPVNRADRIVVLSRKL